jgi:catechol 2,3-dioxygenase-like lactoylglutathione lyase family enzyme
MAPMIESGFVTLYTADMRRALKFFVETLGLKLTGLAGDESAVVDAGGGLRLALVPAIARSPGADSPVGMSIALEVRGDFDVARAVYENRGIAFSVRKTTQALTAHFTDPDGHAFHLIKRL